MLVISYTAARETIEESTAIVRAKHDFLKTQISDKDDETQNP